MKFTAAHEAIADASAELIAMRKAKDVQSYKRSWVNFLHATSKIWPKVKDTAAAHPNYPAWKTKWERARRNDPVVWFFFMARQADAHYSQILTIRESGEMLMQSTGSSHIEGFIWTPEGGLRVQGSGSPLTITFTPDRMALQPIVIGPVTHTPPLPLGAGGSGLVHIAAMQVLNFYQLLIADAEAML